MAIDMVICFGALFRGGRADAVQTVTQLIPSLAEGALERCTVGMRTCARSLLLRATLADGASGEAAAKRLAFWSARAGGMTRRLEAASAAEIESVELALRASDHLEEGVAAEELCAALERAFASLWKPDAEARRVAVPVLQLHAQELRSPRARYDPDTRRLFVASTLAPPVGDEFGLAVDGAADGGGTVFGTVLVTEVRAMAGAEGTAGFFLSPGDEALHVALERACVRDRAAHASPPARMRLTRWIPFAWAGVAPNE